MSRISKESVTFRLDSANLSSLEKEAQRKGVSLNTLVSQIIDRHVDWHMFSADANLVSFPQKFIFELLAKYNDSEIEQIAEKIAQDEVKDIMLLLRRKNDPESFLDIIDTWAKVSNFPYSHEINDTIHEFIIQHDMGQKLSLYLKRLFEFMFESFELKKVEFDTTQNSISFIVDTKKPD